MTESPPDDPLVDVDEVETARERVRGVAHRTPLDLSETFARLSGADRVHCKLENLQKTGSYKIRGAYNRISQLTAEERARGVVAASGGNHAQGVAYAAREHGVDATVVMPEAAPASKVEATRGYGADVVVHGDIYQESYKYALDVVDSEDRVFVPPFNHRAIIAGQGTIALELLEDLPDVDTVVAAIGGGGCISGLGTVVAARRPDTRVVGVQTHGAGHAAPSLAAGEIRELDDVDTIAESIAASRTEPFTFRHLVDRVDDVVEVSDEAVTAAVALLAERAKQVVEPAGALPLAAILDDDLDVTDESVALLVSGGNLDLTEHAALTERGLRELGRYVDVHVAVRNWPGTLGSVVEAVEAADGEVAAVRHDRTADGVSPNRRRVTLSVEVTGPDHAGRVVRALESNPDCTVFSDPTA